MTDEISAAMVQELLPRDLRGELCIASLTLGIGNRALGFRMDPGYSFERRGLVLLDRGTFRIGIDDRYRPGDGLEHMAAGRGTREPQVPDELRRLAGDAWTLSTARPHWRDSLAGRTAKVLRTWPGIGSAAALEAAKTARDTAATCFLCWHGDRAECVTVPPHDCPGFLSVTPKGEWSVHTGTSTYPMSRPPDATVFAAVRPFGFPGPQAVPEVPAQVRLARRDIPATGPPAVSPERRGPGRTGGTPKHAQGRRKR
jgi:hypothetical protein